MQEARDGGGRGEVREQQQPRQADRHAHSVRPQLLRRGQDPHELQGAVIPEYQHYTDAAFNSQYYFNYHDDYLTIFTHEG